MKYSEKDILAFTKYEKTSDLIRETGKSATTIKRYRADPELQKIVRERRNEMMSAAVVTMQNYLSEGAEELIKVIRDPDTSAQTRVNAIQILFNQCRDWMTTTDLQKRIEDVERSIMDVSRG